MIDLSLRRPVATTAIYVALLALGACSFWLIPIELLPEVDYPRLIVSASWNGASPEALEAFVTAPLEAAVQQVRGVRSVRSESRAAARGTGSVATIEVEFARNVRMEFARLEVRERLASLRDELPPSVNPTVQPYVPPEFAAAERPFLRYRLTGPYTLDFLGRLAAEDVAPVLRAIDGVAEARVYGGTDRQIVVELDGVRLEALGLRPEAVQRRILEVSEPRAPGAVELEGQRVALSVRTRARDVADLDRIVVARRSASAVRVGDLGTVRDQAADPDSYHRIDGLPAVSLAIRRQPGSNTLRLAEVVTRRLAEAAATLPPGVRFELDEDLSEHIRRRLSDLRLRAVAAALVVLVVLTAFLRSLGSVLVVFATIGFSALIAVNLLFLGGFSLNVLTLAGLAWGFGLVVDNGIVVLENVERHRRVGASPFDAARNGARQVVLPVVAATLTTAIALVPFLFLQGDLRIYYLPLGYAVGFSILASLFVAFSFVPAWAARLTHQRGRPVATPGTVPHREPLYIRAYRDLLGAALDRPLIVAALCLAGLAGSYGLFDRHVVRGVPWTSFWGQQTYIGITIRFPRGAGLERTDELARSFEETLAGIPQIERFETHVQPQYANIHITFPEAIEETAIPVAIRERLVAHSYRFSGVQVRVHGYGPSFYAGDGGPPSYRIQVFGYNYLRVRDIAEAIAGRLERFPRIRDVDPNASRTWSARDTEFEYYVRPDRSRLAAHDLKVEELLRFVSANLRGGLNGGRLRVGGDEVRYAVKLAGHRAFHLQKLEALRVPVSRGREVRLASVADVGRRGVLAGIRRQDQQYERTVAWEFRGPSEQGDRVRDAVVDAIALPPGYSIEKQGSRRWAEEERLQVYMALAAAVALIYLVTAALFESLAAPFVVLLTLPLALIGVFLIFACTGATFTRTAYIGTIMMAGIVVNNAILIVYHIGELRRGMETRAAILQGTLERVRPILMTTLTTVFGLLPLILFASSQDENIWNALALATIGGLLSSTVFVLVTVPVAYRYLVARRMD